MINNELLYRVAVAYYLEKKFQNKIAEEMGVSRVQVSKYLKMAKERGLVRMEVIPPHLDSKQMRTYIRRFKDAFPVEDVLISPSYSHDSTLMTHLSALAEEYFFQNLSDAPANVGLGWGHSTYEFAKNMGWHDRSSWRIAPLVGGSTFASSKYFNTNHIVHLISEKLAAHGVLLYLPAFMEPSKYRNSRSFMAEYSQIHSIWNNLDFIICGVGNSILRSSFFQNKELSKYVQKLEENKVVGDLLTHHFDIEGRHIPFGIEELMINVGYDQVRRAKKKLIIAYGSHKIAALVGAMRAKLIDVLVTDQNTADSVLGFAAPSTG